MGFDIELCNFDDAERLRHAGNGQLLQGKRYLAHRNCANRAKRFTDDMSTDTKTSGGANIGGCQVVTDGTNY